MSALEASHDEPERASALPVDLDALRIDRGKTTLRARRGPSPFRRLLVALLLIGAGAAGAFFYLRHDGQLMSGARIPTVEAQRVRLVSRGERARAAGFSAAGWVKLPRYHPVVVTPLVEGRLEEVLVIEGDQVAEGQELARIYAKDYEAELEAAEAAVNAACAECEKMAAGYRTQEVAEARSSMDRLQAELGQARIELERSKKLEPSGAIPLEQVQRDATRVETLEADIEKARLRVELLEEGYRKEDVALALAQRAKAEAERDLAALKLGYTTIRSPMTGRDPGAPGPPGPVGDAPGRRDREPLRPGGPRDPRRREPGRPAQGLRGADRRDHVARRATAHVRRARCSSSSRRRTSSRTPCRSG